MKQMKKKTGFDILMALKDKLLLRTSIIMSTMYCVVIAYVKLKCMTNWHREWEGEMKNILL